ncbi:hypothetical protein GUITHDRAFT_76813 [Guillardia theta CCMP2712]|uniref:Heme oxygenase n=1 Tax=Guillardia theta (strain CCMP2712) TaxID=905079 RepID=L1ISQ7_GUITC|nr:hypothetical protein GUITHDRAFT_76813 [Guillardia theta CCMP2712]EKX38939.1 hypothetical protein GUITHDRAFT_76813 [Guillardia theta CCMP2712]|eukprot:XP_005825919.1 hypothetical protein GUITHDRAFT_76813 [Guillardia theta CCMP2712]
MSRQTLNQVLRSCQAILPKSESYKTLLDSSANKRGLSRKLDLLLREGVHDMKVFGLGFLRSIASKDEYVHFTSCSFHFYREMERELDRKAEEGAVVGRLWRKFPELRRAERLREDLRNVGASSDPTLVPMSPATTAYCASIRRAGEEEQGVRIIAHMYVRYFADLFGGRALGAPTKYAVQELKQSPPLFYQWDRTVEQDRRAYIERLYVAINEAAEEVASEEVEKRIVEEARSAFQHNANIYTEEEGLYGKAAQGAYKLVTGYAMAKGRQLMR